MGTSADAEAGLARVDALLVTGGDDVNPDRYRADPRRRPRRLIRLATTSRSR